MNKIGVKWNNGTEWDEFPWGFDDEISAKLWLEEENIKYYKTYIIK